jgi:hypothetical protein
LAQPTSAQTSFTPVTVDYIRPLALLFEANLFGIARHPRLFSA